MKACPFCAEGIQDAAIICKHCGRDLRVPVPPPAATSSTWWKALLAVGGIGLVVLGLFYLWGTTSYSVDLSAAREIVTSLERKSLITNRSCSPSRATITRVAWLSLPNERSREHLMNALSRVCIAEGSGPDVTLVDPDGLVIAQFNGRTIVR